MQNLKGYTGIEVKWPTMKFRGGTARIPENKVAVQVAMILYLVIDSWADLQWQSLSAGNVIVN